MNKNLCEKKFYKCTFRTDIHVIGGTLSTTLNDTNETIIFSNCNFQRSLSIDQCSLNCKILYDTTPKSLSYFINIDRQLLVNNSSINNDFIIYNKNFDNIEIQNTTFNGVTIIESVNSKHTVIYNSLFNSLTSFNYSTLSHREQLREDPDPNNHFDNSLIEHFPTYYIEKFNLQKVIFKSSVTFIETSFPDGLELTTAQFATSPNFLHTRINSKKTSRETFRIIKHSFDSSGNTIEANKYFAEEMKIYSKELFSEWYKPSKWPQMLLMTINQLTSSFGQSYFRPIILLLISILFHVKVWMKLGKGYSDQHILLTNINIFITKAFPLFGAKGPKNEGFELYGIIFYIIYSILIYQTIVALKRHTKR